MRQQTTRISPEDISRQLQYCREVAALSAAQPAQPLAFVDTYGCQQNEADSERIRGYLRETVSYTHLGSCTAGGGRTS